MRAPAAITGLFRNTVVAVLCLLPALRALPVHAEASSGVAIRAGNLTGFGGIVSDVASGTRYKLNRDGDTFTIEFSDNTALLKPPPAPTNVRSLKAAAERADIVVAAGAALREMRIDGHVVIDVLDPTATSPPAAKAVKPAAEPPKPKPEPAQAKAVPPAPLPPERQAAKLAAPPAAKPAEPPAAAKAVKPAVEPPKPKREPEPAQAKAVPPAPLPPERQAAKPAEPPAAKPQEEHVAAPPSFTPVPGPIALVAAPVIPPEGVAFTVPLGPKAGAAVFRRGSNFFVVFDERRPIDLAALRDDSVFGSAYVRELQSGTLVTLQPPPGTGVALAQTATGWKIVVRPDVQAARAIPYAPKDGHLDLPAEAPGNVVSMADPNSGATLLVGTLRRPGQAVLTARRTAEFALLPAVMGVVLEPFADGIALRTVPTGFLVTGGPGGLAITQPTPATEAAAAAVHLTRRFKLPSQSTEALSVALARGIADAAATLPGARGPKRRAVASTMLSLGLGAEAQALLLVAAEQDPKEASSPDTIGLTAIGALLAGRLADSSGIDDPRLFGTDEVALWRGIRQAMAEEGSSNAAATFMATAPLALQYPPGIRDRILPLVAETLVLGGEPAAAKRLLALAGSAPGLGFARALLKQADGDTPGAITALDALAAGHDQRDRARAVTRAVELRLAAGELDAGKAADALDKLRYAWRGDRRELALRERVADLRQRAGGWRSALVELRSLQTDFPDGAQAIQTHLMGMFMMLLHNEATDGLAPLDLVALVDENADLLKQMPVNEALQARLADRLLALDLPSRAGPLLDKLVASATTPTGRATFGAGLADLRLKEGDAVGALAALAASGASDLDPELAEKRGLLASVAKSRLGDAAGAVASLQGLTGVRADTARAAVYEQAGNWAAAEEVLMTVVGNTIPEAGELNDTHRQLVLRLATATQRSGDRNGLAALRATLGSRLGSGSIADMIRFLTAEPVQAVSDLPRAEREMGLVRAVPAALAALKPP